MNRLPLLALLLFVALPVRAQSPEALFAEADSEYIHQNYPRAIELYESIVHNGYVSGELFYNLANAYYRSGNIAHAVLNYERARRLMPEDEDLRHNLQLAGAMITDRIEPTPRLFLWDWWDGLKTAFSLRTITWTAYLFYLLFLGAVCLILLGRRYLLRSIGLWTAGAAAALLGLSLIVMYAKVSDVHRTDEAVIMQSVVTVKNSPDEKSSDAFVLHAGLRVNTIDRVGAWIKIHLADGKVGWVQDTSLEQI
ncbi:MAG TPA: tetratricopeptide repeat protein [Bacteroidota bacterium]